MNNNIIYNIKMSSLFYTIKPIKDLKKNKKKDYKNLLDCFMDLEKRYINSLEKIDQKISIIQNMKKIIIEKDDKITKLENKNIEYEILSEKLTDEKSILEKKIKKNINIIIDRINNIKKETINEIEKNNERIIKETKKIIETKILEEIIEEI